MPCSQKKKKVSRAGWGQYREVEAKDRTSSNDIVELFQGEVTGSDEDCRDREEMCEKSVQSRTCFRADW